MSENGKRFTIAQHAWFLTVYSSSYGSHVTHSERIFYAIYNAVQLHSIISNVYNGIHHTMFRIFYVYVRVRM